MAVTYIKTSHLPALWITSALLLAACGGGGGGGSSTSTPTPTPTPTIVDNTAPTLGFSPTTLTVESGQNGSSVLTATDAIGITTGPSVTCTNGGSFNVSTNVFTAAPVTTLTESVCTASASDAAGNQGSATLTVMMTEPTPDTTAPVVTFSPATLSVASGSTATATLTVTDAGGVSATPTASCTNGGSYNVTSGVFTPAVVTVETTSVCTITVTDDGGNVGTGTLTVTMSPAAVSAAVTLSGTLTYDRVPFGARGNALVGDLGDGLNFNGTVQLPIRQAPVELLNASGAVLESTVSDDNGDYSFTVDSGENVRVRVRSEVQKTAADGPNLIDMQVLDNTSGNALYALQGSLAVVQASNETRDLNAGSGWTGSEYTETRAAAPFALLDTIYGTLEDFIAVDADIDFPAFDVLWSTRNTAERGSVADGQIGTSSFTVSNGIPVIRILGNADNDTDEFDVHVVVHEFGHYFENSLSRADSIGGVHGSNDRLDARVAFGEGWGNALSGMILDDPFYRDSFGDDQGTDFDINVENNVYPGSTGWYSEGSVQSILYDLFDSTDDGADVASFGLGPIYGAFTDPAYRETDAFTTIFAFLDGLRNQPGVVASEVTALTNSQLIFGSGQFGVGETNNGGINDALPVYLPLLTNGTEAAFCSFDDFRIFNKHGNRRYLEFDIPTAGAYRFTMARDTSPAADSGTANSDPDFILFKDGLGLAAGRSAANNIETLTLNLAAGQHVMEAYSFDNIDTLDGGITSRPAGNGFPAANPGDVCFTMSLEAQ